MVTTFVLLVFVVFLVLFVAAIGAVLIRGNGKATKIVVGIVGGILLAFPFVLVVVPWKVRRSAVSYVAITVQHPKPPDFTAQDDYLADVYSSGEEAARSLARQLAVIVNDASQSSPTSVRLDRERSVNAGRGVDETQAILTAFQKQLQASSLGVAGGNQEMISAVLRRLPGGDASPRTLSLTFELHGDPRELKANFVNKVWVRRPSEFAERLGAPRKFFVASGSGSYENDSEVVRQVAAAIEPIVVVNQSFMSYRVPLDDVLIENVARELVTDRFSQSSVSTIAGTPLDPPDQKLFLLVDYSDDKVIGALQRVGAWHATSASTATVAGPTLSWADLFTNLASLAILCLLVAAIYFVLLMITRKLEMKEAVVARHRFLAF